MSQRSGVALKIQLDAHASTSICGMLTVDDGRKMRRGFGLQNGVGALRPSGPRTPDDFTIRQVSKLSISCFAC